MKDLIVRNVDRIPLDSLAKYVSSALSECETGLCIIRFADNTMLSFEETNKSLITIRKIARSVKNND